MHAGLTGLPNIPASLAPHRRAPAPHASRPCAAAPLQAEARAGSRAEPWLPAPQALAARIPPRLHDAEPLRGQLPQRAAQPRGRLAERAGRGLPERHAQVPRAAAGGPRDDGHLVRVHEPGHYCAVIIAACARPAAET